MAAPHLGTGSGYQKVRDLQPGDKAWLALVAGVAAWDILCDPDELLSVASRRYREARPILWPAVVIYVAGHLCHFWPEKLDPLSGLARLIGR